ncbi:low-density lipoprotein receptor-related protein 6 [Periplaneta americana]|uniref:low-density lipoprotein receptor-related protein 6 n=1 Tax=Periplaneta americana TaxID=6978 RepID=UPI0037E9A087
MKCACSRRNELCRKSNPIIVVRMLVASWIALISCLITCINANPNLLFSTSKDIRVVSVSKPSKVVTIVKDLEEGAAIDFYYEGNLVCWTDHGLEMIQCISYNGTYIGSKVDVVTTGLISPAGLACDWLTQKLYWTDGETNRIEVATLKGDHRKVLFWDDIDQPRAITVVPMKSLMFWTDWGEIPKIERAGMNGDPTTRKVIVSENIFWPNGLTVDYDAELVYWLDGRLKFVEVMDYEGRNRRTIVKDGVNYPFALTIFQNKLYWTDWKTWSIHVFDKTSNALPKEIIHGGYVPMDIHVWDAQRQPPGDTPCHHNNGGCSHLCLLAPYPPGYTCACPTGVKLIDNVTCANGAQEMLLLVQRTDICTISLDSPDYTNFVLPLVGIKHAIAIDYDPVNGYLYWTDDEARAIRRARLDGSDQEDLIVTEVEHPDGIAVDWVARNLYWTDTGTDRIEVARLTGASRKVLINEDLHEPRAIALAPEKGWMFWSDWNDKVPKLERAALDGSDRVVLISKDLGWPNGIALDLDNNKIYWCDAKTDKIEVANMADGEDRREVIGDNLPHLFGLSLLGDYLYWTDWQRRSIDRVKVSGDGREVIVDQIPNLMGLKAIRLGEVKGRNPCTENNGNCSHLCLNRPNNNYICACQIGYELAANERTCVVPEAFLLFARKENIGRISIENGNNDAIIPVTGVKDASALDFDINDNRIYWTDVKVKAITRAFMNGSDMEKIVEFGLDSPEGMAVDWVAHNIYWTDTGSKRIEVARLTGRSRKVLIWKGIDEPRSLALDPREGFMYWSDWGSKGSISKAAMDGTQRSIIIAKLGRANGLTIDYVQHRLYWTELEQHVIESSDLEGKQRMTIINQNVEKPFGLTQYLDYIYWADWKTGNIERANKTNGTNRTVIHRHLESITDILIFHNSRQSAWNQCAVGNGGCSHLCLALPSVSNPSTAVNRQSNTHRCGCPTHYTLGDGNKTCIGPRSFLLYGQRNTLSRLLPDSDDCPDVVLPIHSVKNVRALEYDPVSQYIYWIDGRAQSIKRSYDNGTHTGPAFVPASSIHFPYDMALDPYGRVLYWTCANTNAINVTRLDNGSAVGVVVKVEGEKPRNIVLHPEKGLMFWTEVGQAPRILRARMDGKSRIVIASEIENLSALAVDRVADLLFWAQPNQIESSDLNGKGRKILVSKHLVQVTSLAVHGDYLYWVDKDQQQIERVNKTNGNNRTTMLLRLAHLVDIVAVTFPSEKMFSSHGCSSSHHQGGCSHLCIASPPASPTGSSTIPATCSCPQSLVLHEDGRTCSAVPACGPDLFTCAAPSNSNKDCIPSTWRCDGQDDCPDASDEAGCPDCKPDEFRCQTGQCIDKSWVCDGTSQCPDNYDESRCCDFQCARTGVCIPHTAVCDGYQNCPDGSDEADSECRGANPRVDVMSYGDSNKSTYVVSILVTIASVIMLGSVGFYCRRRLISSNNVTLNDDLDDSAGDPLSPKPIHGIAKPICPVAGIQKNCRLDKCNKKPGNDAVRMSMLNGSTTSNSYDRSHITGASSSTTEGGPNGAPLLVSSSSLLCYPRETLNPPPSPATTADSNRKLHHNYNEDYCCSSSGASRYRPYRHYRAINQPPPPTPCSTDVCDESDSNYPPPSRGRQRYYAPPGSEYDSDPFPPPPTPRSHYHSDGGGVGGLPSSCPPSPSSTAGRSSTYFNPLPPPPSPAPSPGSRCDC